MELERESAFWKNRNIADTFIILFGNLNTLDSFTKINHVA